MAWVYNGPERTYIEDPYQMNEKLTVEELESTRPGYFRLGISSSVRSWPGLLFSPKTLQVYLGSTAIDAAPDTPEQGVGSEYVSATVFAELPMSWKGQQLRFTSRLFRDWTAVPEVQSVYGLSILPTEHVIEVTVTRIALGTEFGSLGRIASGAVIYAGDVLFVTAAAEDGYEITGGTGSFTVSGDLGISVRAEPAATVHLFDGESWQRYYLCVFSGGQWDKYQAMVYDGTQWQRHT